MTWARYWMCLGCGGLVDPDYLYTHIAFHERTGTSAEFLRPKDADDQP